MHQSLVMIQGSSSRLRFIANITHLWFIRVNSQVLVQCPTIFEPSSTNVALYTWLIDTHMLSVPMVLETLFGFKNFGTNITDPLINALMDFQYMHLHYVLGLEAKCVKKDGETGSQNVDKILSIQLFSLTVYSTFSCKFGK